MDIGLIGFVKDYAGLVVGLVLLLAAASVLPGRAKWYVLTAGLAVIGYEAYLRYSNSKLLGEADAERKGLQGELGKLDNRRETLDEEVSGLHQQISILEEREADLDGRESGLQLSGEELAAKKLELDREKKQASKTLNETLQLANSHKEMYESGKRLLQKLKVN